MGFLRRWFSRAHITSCDKISAFNYSGPIWGFHQGHWREPPPFSLSRNPRLHKLPLVCLSKPTGAFRHTQQMRRRLLEKIYGAGQLHILWLKGRRVHLIFGDGWYLWQVILEGGSPLLHRSPPLPCLMDITRCPRPNLQFWFWFSPDKKVDIFWHHLMSQFSNFTVFLAVTITIWRNRSNRWTRLFAYWYKLGWWMPMLAVYFIDPWNV